MHSITTLTTTSASMIELIEQQQFDLIYVHILVMAGIILVCWLFAAGSCFIDLWSGVSTARAIGVRLHSHKFRETFTKMGDYWRVLLFGLMFDALGCLFTFYKLPFASMLFAIAVICIELYSVVENSKRKKAGAGKILDVAAQIIECVDKDKAEELVKKINKLNQDKNGK